MLGDSHIWKKADSHNLFSVLISKDLDKFLEDKSTFPLSEWACLELVTSSRKQPIVTSSLCHQMLVYANQTLLGTVLPGHRI